MAANGDSTRAILFALGANFATVNHLLINALVLEAFQEIMRMSV